MISFSVFITITVTSVSVWPGVGITFTWSFMIYSSPAIELQLKKIHGLLFWEMFTYKNLGLTFWGKHQIVLRWTRTHECNFIHDDCGPTQVINYSHILTLAMTQIPVISYTTSHVISQTRHGKWVAKCLINRFKYNSATTVWSKTK